MGTADLHAMENSRFQTAAGVPGTSVTYRKNPLSLVWLKITIRHAIIRRISMCSALLCSALLCSALLCSQQLSHDSFLCTTLLSFFYKLAEKISSWQFKNIYELSERCSIVKQNIFHFLHRSQIMRPVKQVKFKSAHPYIC